MTTAEMRELIGRIGTIPGDGSMRIEVEVRDVKSAYGVPRVLVAPIAGIGQAWINADRVQFTKERIVPFPDRRQAERQAIPITDAEPGDPSDDVDDGELRYFVGFPARQSDDEER
jgi:hypothetical protein